MIDLSDAFDDVDSFQLREIRSAWGGTTLPPINWGDDFGGRGPAGDPIMALQVSAFLACIRVLAEGVAQLPFHLLRSNPDGTKERATDHPLYAVLHDRPNAWQSSYEFRESLVAHTASWGNGFARKVYASNGQIAELWPMHPAHVDVVRLENNALSYVHREPGFETKTYREDQVVHVRFLSDNGYMGMVPLSLSAGADQYYLPANNLAPLPAIVGEAGKPDAGTSAAVLSILQAVAAGTITAASAEALILATFPELSAASVRAMVEGAAPPAKESTEAPAAEASVEAVEPVAVEPANEMEDTGESNGN